ncbi:MAG: universal stress protein [Pseudomonadales bacterium]|nr:universal stress protein [Pseudomonadales bacterium]
MLEMKENMVNTILYATDLGLYGPYMLEHVGDLARSHNAKVYVLHVIEPLGVFADAVLETFVPESSKENLRDHGLNEVMTAIRAKVRAVFDQDLTDYDGVTDWLKDVHVIGGIPAEVILTDAEAIRADLIVMGSHGGVSDATTPIGSVAAKVLQLSPIPVYLIPTSTNRSMNFGMVSGL